MDRIYLNSKDKKKLIFMYETTGASVSMALRFKTNSFLSHRIRNYALNKLNGFAL